MTLFVDGDAFPNLLKPILLRAIERLAITTIAVANKHIIIGKSEHITYITTGQGIDEADNRIVDMVNSGDLVITGDIPLADRVISKGVHAINHRGELFTDENIKHALAMRNLMQDIRDSGEMTGGPAPFSKKDVHGFANQLNQFLSKQNFT